MATTVPETGNGVMMDINTTPLIDIMLVLLIMFLITVPIQTHAVKVDLPGPPSGVVNPVKNKIVIDAKDVIHWNGQTVDRTTLRQYLDLSARMTPSPELHLQPEPDARYQTVDEVLAITKRANVQTMGFVGNEAYANF